MDEIEHLKDFGLIEFRRYLIKDGFRNRFAEYFESFFPEAFEQMSAIVHGQFLDRWNPAGFTWIRGFHDSYERGRVSSNFYYGPLWREHRSRINEMLVDSDNVLLLTPTTPENEIPILPAVDPTLVHSPSRGVVVAQIFPVKPNNVQLFLHLAEGMFDKYRTLGVRRAGLLRTVNGPNTFPQHPIRTDGPFVVWLGVIENLSEFESHIHPLAQAAMPSLSTMESLRGEPELLVLDPTRRSRLRWLPSGVSDVNENETRRSTTGEAEAGPTARSQD